MKYKFYQDAGHGWLRVKVRELFELGILGEISRYSYVSPNAEWAYLEEDCDFAKFIYAKKWPDAAIPHNVQFMKQCKSYSQIRKYPSIARLKVKS